jgi:hypothetical protein
LGYKKGTNPTSPKAGKCSKKPRIDATVPVAVIDPI